MTRNTLVRLFAVLAISASACSGDDGAAGAQGPVGPQGPEGNQGEQGVPGQDGQDGMSAVGGKLKLVIDGVQTATVDGTTTSTVTFTVYPAAAVCPGGTCNDNLSNLGQKTIYATEFDPATKTFTTAKSFNFTGHKFKGLVDGGKGAQYTAKKAGASFAPEQSQHAMVYGYIADQTVLPVKGHYSLYDNVSSASKLYGTVEYASAANVSGCEKCHVAPYSKHGYRQAKVAGLPDFAACKACHTDQRVGSDHDWQKIVDNPADYFTNGIADAERTGKYAYVANIMNDTHMSHAMEFAYPQSMANCVTCHEGKLDAVLADSKFTLTTCKSCHPMDGVGGTDPKRAPALNKIIPAYHPALATIRDCQLCHSDAGGMKTFKQIHAGYTTSIYAAAGKKYADIVKVAIGATTYDSATKEIKFSFTATETEDLAGVTVTDIAPTVMASLYGYGTKDFVVSAHGKTVDTERDLEAKLGGMCDLNGDHEITPPYDNPPTTDGPCPAHPRVVLDSAANGTWNVTVKLADWAALIDGGKVKRVELAVMPDLKNADGAAVALNMVSKTFDLATAKFVDSAAIVDVAKCNKCHDQLATTFHSPDRGGSVVGCRMCHVVGNGAGHYDGQSRSIDSYVHAIHSMQAASGAVVGPIAELRHELHIESTYPSFSILNCESCHNKGTYEVPDQAKSLPSVLSKTATTASVIVGAASRACGSCHRAEAIKENDAAALASFNAHTESFGTLVPATNSFDAVTARIMSFIGGPTAPQVATEKVESCSVCHPNAGAEHQAAFNRWSDGL